MKKESIFIEQIPVGQYKNFSYVVADILIREAAIFDPAWEAPKLLAALQEKNLTLKYIVNTHAHFDHIDGNQKLATATNAKVVMSDKSLARKDLAVKDGEELQIGRVNMRFIHTPGHSPESMCIEVGSVALLTGDTLFIGECGRVDLPGGSAEGLFESFQKLRLLDPELVVYPGHDYGTKRSTTLREQLETNYTLAKRTKQEFIKFMSEP
ncbi:MAG: MBL fold metallo-hydrolase [Nitrososphaerales archaeon]